MYPCSKFAQCARAASAAVFEMYMYSESVCGLEAVTLYAPVWLVLIVHIVFAVYFAQMNKFTRSEMLFQIEGTA